jgi:hypothetical protein
MALPRPKHGFAEAKTTAKLSAAYRLRNVRYWNSRVPDGTAPPPGPGQGAPVDDAAATIDNDAINAVSELAALTARNGDTSAKDATALTKALNSANQVDDVLDVSDLRNVNGDGSDVGDVSDVSDVKVLGFMSHVICCDL